MQLWPAQRLNSSSIVNAWTQTLTQIWSGDKRFRKLGNPPSFYFEIVFSYFLRHKYHMITLLLQCTMTNNLISVSLNWLHKAWFWISLPVTPGSVYLFHLLTNSKYIGNRGGLRFLYSLKLKGRFNMFVYTILMVCETGLNIYWLYLRFGFWVNGKD